MNQPSNPNTFIETLKRHSPEFGNILPFALQAGNTAILDFTSGNRSLANIDLCNTAAFQSFIQDQLRASGTIAGAGGYNEERVIYKRSALFTDASGEPRFIHLGIDIWIPAGTAILAPLTGQVHSLKDNQGFGDYGPTIILEHRLEDLVFFTLYGHLSQNSLNNLKKGAIIEKGRQVGTVGDFPENGDWPPHVHVQLITDIQGFEGDFTGVCSLKERAQFLRLCPDPNLILRIPHLPG